MTDQLVIFGIVVAVSVVVAVIVVLMKHHKDHRTACPGCPSVTPTTSCSSKADCHAAKAQCFNGVCKECAANSDCQTPEVFCVTEGDNAGVCVECNDSNDCDVQEICHDGQCHKSSLNQACLGPNDNCASVLGNHLKCIDHRCIKECTTDNDCPGEHCNTHGACQPKPLPFPACSPELAAGYGFFLASGLTFFDSKTFVETISLGNNDQGQLGRQTAETYDKTIGKCGSGWDPPPPPMWSQMASVAAGFNHSVVLDMLGTVWVFGSNNFGQCGATVSNVWTPTKALNLPHIVQVAAGGDVHSSGTVLLDANGSIWTCGNINGTDINGTDKAGFVKEETWGQDNARIATCGKCTVVLKSSGKLFFAGLPYNASEKTKPEPGKLLEQWGSENIQISMSSTHLLALQKDGSVFAGGTNLDGEVVATAFQPWPAKNLSHFRLQGQEITQVSAGVGFSLYLDKTGAVFAQGNNQHRQIDNSVKQKVTFQAFMPQRPNPEKSVSAVCAGDTFCLLRLNRESKPSTTVEQYGKI